MREPYQERYQPTLRQEGSIDDKFGDKLKAFLVNNTSIDRNKIPQLNDALLALLRQCEASPTKARLYADNLEKLNSKLSIKDFGDTGPK